MASVFVQQDMVVTAANSTEYSKAWALACHDATLQQMKDGGDRQRAIKQARDLFRGALSAGADERTIFDAWMATELGHGGVAAARACFEEWRSRAAAAGRRRLHTDFWCCYIGFEMEFGTAARSRDVAEAALAACPRDPVLFALYAKLELHRGNHTRARCIVRRAREILTADVYPMEEEAAKWVENEAAQYQRYLHEEAAKRPTIAHVFRYLLCGRQGQSA